MPEGQKTNAQLREENIRLRAQAAQLEDRLDHLTEHGSAASSSTREWESLHHDVMSVVSDAVLIADTAGRLTYVSPNVHFIFGHSQAEIARRGRISLLLPHDLFDADVLEQRGEIANIECPIRDAVGRARSLLVTVRRIEGHGGGVLYVCRDVTERKKLQADHDLLSLTLERRVEERTSELRESRERYRRLVEGLRDEYFFYATDPRGIITYISPSIHNILGYTPEQLLGHNWREFVDMSQPVYAELEELERMRFAGIATPKYCSPIPRADGEIRMLEFRDAPLLDVDGRIVANEGIAKDITERHRSEDSLRRIQEELEQRVRERTSALTVANEQLCGSEQRYRSVVEDQLEFIVRWRFDGVVTFVNEAYRQASGKDREELIGSSFMPTIIEEDRDALEQKLADVSVESPVVVQEHRVVMPDQQIEWQRWSHRAFFDERGKLVEFQSVGSDITDRRRREEQARESAVAIVQLQNLTDREHDVMRLVVAGNANKVIARKLELSVKTIEKHRSSLMKKLHVRSVPELVRLALLAGDGSEPPAAGRKR